MWKYRHFVKENPKSGYDWSADRVLCVSTRNWECRRPCAQSGRQSKNAPFESWDLMWTWHSLTDWLTVQKIIYRDLRLTVSNNVARSSCLKPIASPDWLATSSCCKRYSVTSYGLEMKIVYRRTTIQLVERLGLQCMYQLITGSDTSIPRYSHPEVDFWMHIIYQ